MDELEEAWLAELSEQLRSSRNYFVPEVAQDELNARFHVSRRSRVSVVMWKSGMALPAQDYTKADRRMPGCHAHAKFARHTLTPPRAAGRNARLARARAGRRELARAGAIAAAHHAGAR